MKEGRITRRALIAGAGTAALAAPAGIERVAPVRIHDADALARSPNIALKAGMPAEVFVSTGSRSISRSRSASTNPTSSLAD